MQKKELIPGRTFNEKFILGKKIGRGGTAEVYKGTDTTTGNTVALKVFKNEYPLQEADNEALIHQKLIHSHIIHLFEYDREAEYPYIAMRFADGKSVKERLKREGRASIHCGVHILAQTAAGIEYAHQQGVLHRDIKPDNILFHEENGVPNIKVIDWGMAVKLKKGEKTYYEYDPYGTPAYVPHERVGSEEEIISVPEGDIYSLGVVGYELFTGRNPYNRITRAASAMAHLTAKPPLFEDSLKDNMAKNLEPIEEVVHTALAFKPEERYQSMEAFRDAIKEGFAKSKEIERQEITIIDLK